MGFEDFLNNISNFYNNTSDVKRDVYNPEPIDSTVNGVSYSRSNIDLIRNNLLGLGDSNGGGGDFIDPSLEPPGAEPEYTTLAVGEEEEDGGFFPPGGPDLTTLAVGEEEDIGLLPPMDNTYSGDNQNIDTGSGNDRIAVYGDGNEVDTNAGRDEVELIGNDNDVDTSSGNDTVISTGYGNKVLTRSGEDLIINTGDSAYLSAGGGNDEIHHYGENSDIYSGSGSDSLHVVGDFNAVRTSSGNDDVYAEGWMNLVNMGSGNDTLELGFDFNGTEVIGGSGIDTVLLQGLERDYEIGENEATGDKTYTHLSSGQQLTIASDVENVNFTGQYQGGDYATTLAMGEEDDDGIYPPPSNPGPPGSPSDGGNSNIPTINLRNLFGGG